MFAIAQCDEREFKNYKRLSPDTDRYALFSDGLLLLSEEMYGKSKTKCEFIIKDLQAFYPDMVFKVQLVHDEYITKIYNDLQIYQKGAGKIYTEMLKQRAKKLKKEQGISHYEALEIVAKAEGFQNWKAVTQINETDAHYAIGVEKARKKRKKYFENSAKEQ